MSLGAAIALAAVILAGMLALVFVLAAVEEGLLASIMVDPVADDAQPTVELVEVEPLQQAA